jgi:hypothetical protein
MVLLNRVWFISYSVTEVVEECKHVFLATEQKVEIVQKLGEGSLTKNITMAYVIRKTIIHSIWKNKDKLLNYGSSSDSDRLCGLVVRVPGYRSRGPGFDSRRCQIF